MVLSVLSLASCGNDDDDDKDPSKRALLTGGEWKGQMVLFDGVDYSDSLEAVGLDVSNFRLLFKDDGTGTSNFLGQTSNGSWEFGSNEQSIIFGKGTADESQATIKKLTATELYLEFAADELGANDPNDPVQVEKVEMRFGR